MTIKCQCSINAPPKLICFAATLSCIAVSQKGFTDCTVAAWDKKNLETYKKWFIHLFLFFMKFIYKKLFKYIKTKKKSFKIKNCLKSIFNFSSY